MLQKSIEKLTLARRRMWTALRRKRTWAERQVTAAWQKTVLFEPFGGQFTISRVGTEKYGWTCTQPMDIAYGKECDLLSEGGEANLFKALEEQDPYLTVVAFPCWMWSQLTNCSPRKNWEELRQKVGKRLLKLVVEI